MCCIHKFIRNWLWFFCSETIQIGRINIIVLFLFEPGNLMESVSSPSAVELISVPPSTATIIIGIIIIVISSSRINKYVQFFYEQFWNGSKIFNRRYSFYRGHVSDSFIRMDKFRLEKYALTTVRIAKSQDNAKIRTFHQTKAFDWTKCYKMKHTSTQMPSLNWVFSLSLTKAAFLRIVI